MRQADVVAGHIAVRGAVEHNLRDVDVDLPRDQLVAFTGISGSGKSSLAFGTLFAQAQQRYLESVSPYARRLIDQGSAPRVRSITGLPPAVALRQQHGGGSRSSVGTVSRVSNVLRMLFSRAGTYPPGFRPADLAGSFPRDAAPLDSDSFSPNTAVGACRECSGLGHLLQVDIDSLVGDAHLSIEDGAIAAWPGAFGGKNYRRILRILGIDVDAPFSSLPRDTREWVLTTQEQPTVDVEGRYKGTYMSPKRWVEHTYRDSPSARMRATAAAFMVQSVCPLCHGKRLNPEALAVTIAGRDIADVAALPLQDLDAFLDGALIHPDTLALPAERLQAARALILAVREHAKTLVDLGLGYLATSRATPTLSGGERQRLHLATQLRSGLFGVLYVLDEPSAGLHPADTEPLAAALEGLRDAGNTVFVVEHRPSLVAAAHTVVDLGPGAGRYGGEVLYVGSPSGLADVADSVTGRYLGPDAPPVPAPEAARMPAGWVRLRGIAGHNLHGLDVELPLGCLSALSGVSGSGKSSVLAALGGAARRAVRGTAGEAGPEGAGAGTADQDAGTGPEPAREPIEEEAWTSVDDELRVGGAAGLEAIDRVVVVDQRPIGRTPRSTLATYTGLFDIVRKLFAAQPEARRRRFGASRFSYNLPAGRCPHCLGEGEVSIELLFMPTETVRCPECGGGRYNPETLHVLYDGLSVADMLRLSVDEARAVLADVPAALRILDLLRDIGLGYLALGQSATTLSGGEAQRIKLVSELHRAPRGHGLFLLDEPTTGLHPADVDLLVGRLQSIVEAGNTVVMAEHDVRTLRAADWIVDLGPGAGERGGRVVAVGTPEALAHDPASVTGEFLLSSL